MGKVYEWSRLDGRGNDVEELIVPTFRTRRVHGVTARDWLVWWLKRELFDDVRCPAWIVGSLRSVYREQLALQQSLKPLSTRVCWAPRAGLRDIESVQE